MPWIERFIPTCVGLGSSRRGPHRKESVHPHVRGAWGEKPTTRLPGHGPSPRAWGLDISLCQATELDRSIPTCVGLGAPKGCSQAPARVHPHVRGAWCAACPHPHRTGGPSPRAWGLDQPHQRRDLAERSIPTCVGLGGPCGQDPGQDSDRVHGPSPRAWGLATCMGLLLIGLRSIPTCVGLGHGP